MVIVWNFVGERRICMSKPTAQVLVSIIVRNARVCVRYSAARVVADGPRCSHA